MKNNTKFYGKLPMKRLDAVVGKKVTAKLKDGIVYSGTLTDVDGYMNIVLQSATEYSDDIPVATYKEIYIRGDTLLYIRLNPLS